MKVVGITMVRNEADIVDLTIRHHLRLGCESVLAVDNGSVDGTTAVLKHLATRDTRIKWSVDPGPYRQSEVMTDLATESFRLGADWVLPFDADEFWWFRGRRRMTDFLEQIGNDVGALEGPVVNFVQSRRRRHSSRLGLLRLGKRAVPVPPADDAKRLVTERKIGFVEIVYPPKTIFRPGPDVVLARGNHLASNVSGSTVACDEVACLHAPLRSREILEAQVGHGRRIMEVATDSMTAWHVRRWVDLWEHDGLEAEWAANSYTRGNLDVYGQRHKVERDRRLQAVLGPLLMRHPFR